MVEPQGRRALSLRGAPPLSSGAKCLVPLAMSTAAFLFVFTANRLYHLQPFAGVENEMKMVFNHGVPMENRNMTHSLANPQINGRRNKEANKEQGTRNASLDGVSTAFTENIKYQDSEARSDGHANARQSDDGRRMNVVVLFPDDWRWDEIGKENPIIQTPFLDELADRGIRFPQNAVTTSICWQSRATLFTGQWAHRHKSYQLHCPNFTRRKKWNATWPAILQDNGYHVGHVGKWQYANDNNMQGRFDFARFFEGYHRFEAFGGGFVAAEDQARDETIRFLNQRPKGKPFAVTVAFYPPKPVGVSREPGGQWQPKNESRALYNNLTMPEPYNHTKAFKRLPDFLRVWSGAAAGRWRERYPTPEHYQESMKNIYALITQVDQACKEIVDELKKQGQLNNTMIIFTTDNGMFHGSHGLAGKWYPYQESMRVPLIVYDPRMPDDKIGTVDDSFTLNVDLAETILGAAGLGPHATMQGRDMSDLYLPNVEGGKTALERDPWRDEFFYEFTFGQENYIPSSKALVRKDYRDGKKWKLIHWYHFEKYELFDLEEDPLELNNVYNVTANAGIASEMERRLLEMQDGMNEPGAGCVDEKVLD